LDIRQQKEEIRAELLNLRKTIPLEDFEVASQTIVRKLKQLSDFKKADIIHCYVSMNDRREVNTHGLIREMLLLGKTVVVPITNFNDGTLGHVKLDSFNELRSNKWGVLEPNNGKRVSVDKMELVIVPMVGGDEHGNRIGYGAGFYDRFLKEVSCPKIGLIFDRNIVKKIPVEAFDIPLDKIITEKRVIHRE
jgi:5-formyltetrahydrofolate cyclo-ligase